MTSDRDLDSVLVRSPSRPDHPADGDALLTDVRDFVRRFCVFPSEQALVAVTLWAAHAHMVQHFYITPRLALLSQEPQSGKTRVLEILDLLAPQSMFSVNASAAAIFRTLVDRPITLLMDEGDAIFKKGGKDDSKEDLRALLNAGYKRGATIPRCVGPHHEVRHFPVFCAVALAGLGELPDTIMSRSVIVRMRRRAPGESVTPFRARDAEGEGRELRHRLATWAELVGVTTGEARPALPDGIVDRPAEVWEPLVAVADAAGGQWSAIARAACTELCKVAEDREMSLGTRLLADMRTVFADAPVLPTETILARLKQGEHWGLAADAPWDDLNGQGLAPRRLAELLRGYGIKPRKVKYGGRPVQGYRREDLHDAWNRYLPAPTPLEAELPEPMEPIADVGEQAEVLEVPQVPAPAHPMDLTGVTRDWSVKL